VDQDGAGPTQPANALATARTSTSMPTRPSPSPSNALHDGVSLSSALTPSSSSGIAIWRSPLQSPGHVSVDL
jgi:hypothetical protein